MCRGGAVAKQGRDGGGGGGGRGGGCGGRRSGPRRKTGQRGEASSEAGWLTLALPLAAGLEIAPPSRAPTLALAANLDGSFLRGEGEVVGLDVAMHDAPRVHVRECAAHLPPQGRRRGATGEKVRAALVVSTALHSAASPSLPSHLARNLRGLGLRARPVPLDAVEELAARQQLEYGRQHLWLRLPHMVEELHHACVRTRSARLWSRAFGGWGAGAPRAPGAPCRARRISISESSSAVGSPLGVSTMLSRCSSLTARGCPLPRLVARRTCARACPVRLSEQGLIKAECLKSSPQRRRFSRAARAAGIHPPASPSGPRTAGPASPWVRPLRSASRCDRLGTHAKPRRFWSAQNWSARNNTQACL